MYKNKLKRVIDIIISCGVLIVFSWLYLLIIIAIKIDSPGKVFFRQRRVGIHKTYFQILKFRTMREETPRDMPTHMLKDPDQYITRVGRFLRKTSMDEIPQFINILVGDNISCATAGRAIP